MTHSAGPKHRSNAAAGDASVSPCLGDLGFRRRRARHEQRRSVVERRNDDRNNCRRVGSVGVGRDLYSNFVRTVEVGLGLVDQARLPCLEQGCRDEQPEHLCAGLGLAMLPEQSCSREIHS